MLSKVVHSSVSDEWSTPRGLFRWLQIHRKWSPDVDAAASVENHVCDVFYTKERSALTHSWKKHSRVWINPPYSLSKEFVYKAVEEYYKHDLDVYLLLAARTGRDYWEQIFINARVIEFIQGRLYFGGAQASAPFDSVLVRFCPPDITDKFFGQIKIPLEFRR